MVPAFDGTERDRIDDEPGFGTRLDDEQPGNLAHAIY
jgi:hypothetical protein